jgi:hypothetical protein
LGHVVAATLVALVVTPAGARDAGVAPARTPAAERVPAPAWYSVAGHTLKLEANDVGCWIVDRVKAGDERKYKLDLQPPCYLLIWRGRPPGSAVKNADGVAVGDVGQPMAWRYKSAHGAVALAVIGDAAVPQPEPESLYQSRKRAGYHCAGSLQGVKLQGARVRLQKKAGEGLALYCDEIGIDEKDFWLIAHD